MANSSTSAANDHVEYLFETSSRWLTEGFTAAHNFEVAGYSMLEGMGAGHYVSSSTFSVGGRDWKIMFYTDGWDDKDGAAYASAALYFCGGEPGVKVQYTFSLLDKDGSTSMRKRVQTYTFDSTHHIDGYRRFFVKSMLQQLLAVDDDCFTIRCVMTVMVHRIEDVSPIVVPQSDLHEHLANMLKELEGADVTFSVDDQMFRAHRCVLAARSPVFKAELFGQMKENATQPIRIDDMEPAIFEALLHFIYTDSLPDSCGEDKNVAWQHLLVAADRYGLDRLKAMCEGKLCQSIDVQIVATTLAIAEQHHCVQLKNACLAFMSSHGVLSAIKETDGFKHLISSCPLVLMEILDKLAVARGTRL